MSPVTRTALRLLKAKNGYHLQLGIMLYSNGDFRGLATKFNEELSIEVLREKYADEHAIGVIGWFEFDSKVEDAQKIAKLVMASA